MHNYAPKMRTVATATSIPPYLIDAGVNLECVFYSRDWEPSLNPSLSCSDQPASSISTKGPVDFWYDPYGLQVAGLLVRLAGTNGAYT